MKALIALLVMVASLGGMVYADSHVAETIGEDIFELSIAAGYLVLSAVVLVLGIIYFSGKLRQGLIYAGLGFLFIGVIKEIVEIMSDAGIISSSIPYHSISEVVGMVLLIIGAIKFYQGTPKFRSLRDRNKLQ